MKTYMHICWHFEPDELKAYWNKQARRCRCNEHWRIRAMFISSRLSEQRDFISTEENACMVTSCRWQQHDVLTSSCKVASMFAVF